MSDVIELRLVTAEEMVISIWGYILATLRPSCE